MIAKSILLLLGAVLLLQGYNAAPYKDIDDALKVLQKRLQLLHFAQAEHNVIDKELLSHGYEVMKKVLEDPKVLAVKTDELQSALDEIRSFVKNYEEYEKNGEENFKQFQHLVEQYHIVTEKYAEMDHPYSKPPEVVFLSFKENGYKKYEVNKDPRMNDITDNFYNEVKKYYDGLSKADKERESDIQYFMDDFQKQKNAEKKDILISLFFARIKLKDFLWGSYQDDNLE